MPVISRNNPQRPIVGEPSMRPLKIVRSRWTMRARDGGPTGWTSSVGPWQDTTGSTWRLGQPERYRPGDPRQDLLPFTFVLPPARQQDRPPLHCACLKGHLEGSNELIGKGPSIAEDRPAGPVTASDWRTRPRRTPDPRGASHLDHDGCHLADRRCPNARGPPRGAGVCHVRWVWLRIPQSGCSTSPAPIPVGFSEEVCGLYYGRLGL